MVTPAQLSSAAYEVVASRTGDVRVAEAARRRARALGAQPLPTAAPRGTTASRALHEARAALESAEFSLSSMDERLAALLANPSCASEARVIAAASRLREARRLAGSGDAGGASERAVSALGELSSALSADPSNREGLALLDQIEELTGYERLTDEVRRAMG